MRDPDEAHFLRDIADHRITVLQDDGIHRHVQFRRPGTYCMGFDLVTWPGYLCLCGDMGDYVFSRIPDMFEFFREAGDGALRINPPYWAEKCKAADTAGCGIKQYSPEKFKEALHRYLEDTDDSLRDAALSELLCCANDTEYEARRAVMEFEHDGRTPFADFWETDLRDYTYHFIWCCYALAWGIRQYDAAKERATASDTRSGLPDRVETQ